MMSVNLGQDAFVGGVGDSKLAAAKARRSYTRRIVASRARQGHRNKGAEHLVPDQSVARLEAFFGVQRHDDAGEPAFAAHSSRESRPTNRPLLSETPPGSSLSANPSSTAVAKQQLGATKHYLAVTQPGPPESTRRHHKRMGQLDQNCWTDPSPTVGTQAEASGAHQAAAVQAMESGAGPLDSSGAAATAAGKQQAVRQQQHQQQEVVVGQQAGQRRQQAKAGNAQLTRVQQQQAAAPAMTSPPVGSGSHLPQVAMDAPDLSHLPQLASSRVMSAASRFSAQVPQLPSLELEAPSLPLPRIALPKVELPDLQPPQLPSFSLPQLPKVTSARLPELPSIELQGVDLEALREQLGCMREFSVQQWANLRAAASHAARLNRQAQGSEVAAPAQQHKGQQAAAAGMPGQQQVQRRQHVQQQAAPMDTPPISPQQVQQVAVPAVRLGTSPPGPQSHRRQQQQQAVGDAGPSHHAMTAEAAEAEGLYTSRHEQQSMAGQVVQAAPPTGQHYLPRLGLREWRTGGLTAWGWGLLLLLGALAAGGLRAAQGRRQHAAQQAVREAEQRAREAQRKERQRRRFQRALLAAEDFEGSSVDSIAFTSVSKKRGNPSVALKDSTPPAAKSAAEQDGSLTTSSQGTAPLSSSVSEAAAVPSPNRASPAGSATAAPDTGSGMGREGLLAAAAPAASADHTSEQHGAGGAVPPPSRAAAVAQPGSGAAAAGDGAAVVARDAAGDNPFLRGMGAFSTFSFDEESPEDPAGHDASSEDEGEGDDVYDPRSWDQQTRREWDSFVNSSKVGQGKWWDTSQIDQGLPQTHVDLDKD